MNLTKLGIRQKDNVLFCLRNHHTKHEINQECLKCSKKFIESEIYRL